MFKIFLVYATVRYFQQTLARSATFIRRALKESLIFCHVKVSVVLHSSVHETIGLPPYIEKGRR